MNLYREILERGEINPLTGMCEYRFVTKKFQYKLSAIDAPYMEPFVMLKIFKKESYSMSEMVGGKFLNLKTVIKVMKELKK